LLGHPEQPRQFGRSYIAGAERDVVHHAYKGSEVLTVSQALAIFRAWPSPSS
jgi:hypothetical protein